MFEESQNISDDFSVDEVHDDFEIVDVNDVNGTENAAIDGEHAQEFDFPLFSLENVPEESKDEQQLMKISLNEESSEIIQERPREYYFSQTSEHERLNIEKSAISYDAILTESKKGPYQGWKKFRGKVIDLKEYNRIIDKENEKKLRNEKRRPGKKQRLVRKLGIRRVEERKAKDVELKRMRKKMFHKRGGKKNKKKTNVASTESNKPKFRTE